MLPTLLEFPARAFQLLDITIELFNVLLGLFRSQPLGFRARMFCLGAFTLSSLSLRSRGADVFEIFFVGEIDDRDDRKRSQYSVKTDGAFQPEDSAGSKRAHKISQ